MKQLQHLSLESCYFSGNIPPQLGNLTNLRSLDLSGNDFDIIPLPLGNLTNLRSLDLSRNDFRGIRIPEFIGSMKELQHLSLKRCNFSGIVPTQLGNLTNLRSLDLSHNSLNSILPFTLGSVFESLETLVLCFNQFTGSMPDLRGFPSLTKLNLRGNIFTGPIPLNIGQLSRLQVLDLSHNSLEGLVPLSIGQLSNLQVLYLSRNSLEGVVSESHFSKLDMLKSLDLSFNSLILDIASDWSPPFQLDNIHLARCNVGPYFPKWLQTQRSLVYLNLDGVNITDEAPKWLASMSPLLEELSLSYNQISGTVPNISSTSIRYMDLSYNQFSGPIPLFPADAYFIQLRRNMLSSSISSICETPRRYLEYFDLSNNRLRGDVPDCWDEMPSLRYLNLANNSFSGATPRSFGALHNLRVLQMHGNNLSGELPYNLRHCRELKFIDVGGNKLTGEIPHWIGQLHGMELLNLRGNRLNGKIPLEICNLTNIHVLDLSINSLFSIIPDCFNNFIVLASNIAYDSSITFGTTHGNYEKWEFEYSTFQWKGKELEYRKNLELLKLIDFSSNRLIGNIPISFSNMRYLNSLNLSRNSLTGYIIPDIGKMKMLDSLDLSHNRLSGKIPLSLANIYTLGVLDLSNNNLSGKIPTGTQLQSFNASSYTGNDGLCGDPLPMCPGDSLRPSTTNPIGSMSRWLCLYPNGDEAEVHEAVKVDTARIGVQSR
ncbi:receptor-like protein EIX2 [Salvia divinorum]|uniref:Receptor-like protein EIX2 n=1 Tax=Salvia divinorum TaxID=28513 RepID=A0ABD1HGS7_SALDI